MKIEFDAGYVAKRTAGIKVIAYCGYCEGDEKTILNPGLYPYWKDSHSMVRGICANCLREIWKLLTRRETEELLTEWFYWFDFGANAVDG